MHPAAHELSYEQTIPRALVHRTALSEVYVADSIQAGEDEFVLAFQVPRAHCVWFDRRVPYHDPLSTAEAARQGVYVVVHRHIGLPPGVVFSLRRLELRVEQLECYRDDGRAPLQGVLALRLAGDDRSSGVRTMRFEGAISIDGTVAATLGGDLVLVRRDDYEALRGYQRRRAPESPAPPAAVPALEAAASGRLDRRNSVLAEPAAGSASDAIRYPVVVDQRHPSFFDHGYDHVPGPLIVEAYRQAAIVTAHRAGVLPSPLAALSACNAVFTEFAELDAWVECTAVVDEHRDDGRVIVEVGLVQFDRQVSTGEIELQPYPTAHR